MAQVHIQNPSDPNDIKVFEQPEDMSEEDFFTNVKRFFQPAQKAAQAAVKGAGVVNKGVSDFVTKVQDDPDFRKELAALGGEFITGLDVDRETGEFSGDPTQLSAEAILTGMVSKRMKSGKGLINLLKKSAVNDKFEKTAMDIAVERIADTLGKKFTNRPAFDYDLDADDMKYYVSAVKQRALKYAEEAGVDKIKKVRGASFSQKMGEAIRKAEEDLIDFRPKGTPKFKQLPDTSEIRTVVDQMKAQKKQVMKNNMIVNKGEDLLRTERRQGKEALLKDRPGDAAAIRILDEHGVTTELTDTGVKVTSTDLHGHKTFNNPTIKQIRDWLGY